MMESVRVLENPGVQFVEIHLGKVTPLCPVSGEKFAVYTGIKYHPWSEVIEFISFRKWLVGMSEDETLTVEDMACLVLDQVKKSLGPNISAQVTTHILSSPCGDFGDFVTSTVTTYTENWRGE